MAFCKSLQLLQRCKSPNCFWILISINFLNKKQKVIIIWMQTWYLLRLFHGIEFRIWWAFGFNLRRFSYSSITRSFTCCFLPPVWWSYSKDPKVTATVRFWYILRTQPCHLWFSLQILDMSSNAFLLHNLCQIYPFGPNKQVVLGSDNGGTSEKILWRFIINRICIILHQRRSQFQRTIFP